MSGPIATQVNALQLEQGSLKSEIHQLKDLIQQLVNRFDAKDELAIRTLFKDSYGFHVMTHRDGTPGFVAESTGGAGAPHLNGVKGIGVTPYAAQHDLISVLERRKLLHIHGRSE